MKQRIEISLVIFLSVAMAGLSLAESSSSNQQVNVWGSVHETFGGAKLVHVPQLDSLTVIGNNQKSSGVNIRFGEKQVRGFGPVMSFAQNHSKNGTFTATMLGPEETADGRLGDFTVVGQITIRQDNGIYEITPDFSSIGAQSYQLQVFKRGVLVYTQSEMTGTAVRSSSLITSSRIHSPKPIARSHDELTHLCFLGTGVISIRSGEDGGEEAAIRIENGPLLEADEIVLVAENHTRQDDTIAALHASFSGFKAIQIGAEHFHFQDLPH